MIYLNEAVNARCDRCDGNVPSDSTGASTDDDGSILVVVGTNAPVSALTLKAMARRAALRASGGER